jgi:hypothetical protein
MRCVPLRLSGTCGAVDPVPFRLTRFMTSCVRPLAYFASYNTRHLPQYSLSPYISPTLRRRTYLRAPTDSLIPDVSFRGTDLLHPRPANPPPSPFQIYARSAHSTPHRIPLPRVVRSTLTEQVSRMGQTLSEPVVEKASHFNLRPRRPAAGGRPQPARPR